MSTRTIFIAAAMVFHSGIAAGAQDTAPPLPELRAPIHDEKPVAPPAVLPEKTPPSVKPSSSRKRGNFLGYVAGMAVAAPRAMVRQSAREFGEGVKDLTNDSPNPILRVPAAIITLPFSIFAGCIEGGIYATRYRNGDNAPSNMAD